MHQYTEIFLVALLVTAKTAKKVYINGKMDVRQRKRKIVSYSTLGAQIQGYNDPRSTFTSCDLIAQLSLNSLMHKMGLLIFTVS